MNSPAFRKVVLFVWILMMTFSLVMSFVTARRAHAADETPPSLCIDLSGVKERTDEAKGRWIQLTSDQWQFLRGIYAINPLTPPGLPYGDKAALSVPPQGDSGGGVVFFIDGDKACTPMPVPKNLLDMLDDVATGKIMHEGAGL